MKNNSILYGVGAALSFVLFIGCATQTKSSYVLNPDMSGKCMFEEKIGLDAAQLSGFMNLKKGADNPFAGGDDTAVQTPQQVALAFASKLLASKGIEPWSDVHFGLIGRDTVYFKGTGYFKNLANVNLAMLDTLFTISTNEHGETILEAKQPPKTAASDSATRAARGIANSILPKGGTTNAMIHYYMAAFLRGLDIKITYQLPGKIISYSSFRKVNDNTVELHLTGEGLTNSMDSLMNTNLSALSGMGDPMSMGKSSNPSAYGSFLFGGRDPLKVVFESGGKPQFNYNREAEEAAKNYIAFRNSSGIQKFDDEMEAIKKKKEEELIREHGVLVLTAKDSADYKVYFKTLEADQSYGTISLLGTFSRKINAGSYATVDILKVYDDKGNNLTDSLSNSKDISSYLSDDVYSYDDTLHLKAKAQFSVRPNSLPDGCKVLNLEGVLKVDSTYVIPFKVKDIYIKDEGSKYGEFPKR